MRGKFKIDNEYFTLSNSTFIIIIIIFLYKQDNQGIITKNGKICHKTREITSALHFSILG